MDIEASAMSPISIAAMQALARVAELTLRQMRLVVTAHFRSETRDVVAPSGKDLADDAVSTLCHQSRRTPRARRGLAGRKLQSDRRQRFMLCREHQSVMQQAALLAQGTLSRCARDLRMIVLLRKVRQNEELGTSIIVARSGIPRVYRWRDGRPGS